MGAASVLNSAGAEEANPENLPPNVPEWTPYLGEGVDANPYGMPSEFESHVVRRNVEWLTASAESSVNFTPLHELDGIVTPNGLCFERHHGGVVGRETYFALEPGRVPALRAAHANDVDAALGREVPAPTTKRCRRE